MRGGGCNCKDYCSTKDMSSKSSGKEEVVIGLVYFPTLRVSLISFI